MHMRHNFKKQFLKHDTFQKFFRQKKNFNNETLFIMEFIKTFFSPLSLLLMEAKVKYDMYMSSSHFVFLFAAC